MTTVTGNSHTNIFGGYGGDEENTYARSNNYGAGTQSATNVPVEAPTADKPPAGSRATNDSGSTGSNVFPSATNDTRSSVRTHQPPGGRSSGNILSWS